MREPQVILTIVIGVAAVASLFYGIYKIIKGTHK